MAEVWSSILAEVAMFINRGVAIVPDLPGRDAPANGDENTYQQQSASNHTSKLITPSRRKGTDFSADETIIYCERDNQSGTYSEEI